MSTTRRDFIRANAGERPERLCWRFASISARLSKAGGALTMDGAMALLQEVSQPNTQWSIVYGMATGQIDVVMNRQYGAVHKSFLARKTVGDSDQKQGTGIGE